MSPGSSPGDILFLTLGFPMFLRVFFLVGGKFFCVLIFVCIIHTSFRNVVMGFFGIFIFFFSILCNFRVLAWHCCFGMKDFFFFVNLWMF